MIVYIIKFILSSTLFFFAYKALFENEKALRFNRAYLLLSIVFSFIVPVLPIPASSEILSTTEIITLKTDTFNTLGKTENLVSDNDDSILPAILLAIYITVTTLLIFRFAFNLRALLSRVSRHQVIPYENAKLVLVKNHLVPYNFLKYIFIDNENYNNGHIEPEVLLHELTHVRQKHSLDVLFIELVQAFAWFNPILLFYRKAITLNHEFLADESVINHCSDTAHYQYLLINKTSSKSQSLLTNQFNYLITKKRLVMMTKSPSPKRILCKQIVLIPLLIAEIFMFSVRTVAQDPANNIKSKQKESQSIKEGLSQELMNEYESIVSRNKLNSEYISPTATPRDISQTDFARLKTIFLSMSKAQQEKQVVTFERIISTGNKPSEKEFTAIKSKGYSIRIDDKKVDNIALNNYKPSDFGNISIVYLAKTNSNYGKHLPVDVHLMTKEYYKSYAKKMNDRNDYVMRTSFKKVAQK